MSLTFFNSVSRYALPVTNPRAELMYSIKFRLNAPLARKVWNVFKLRHPNHKLEYHVTKKGKVLLGGTYNKEHIDTTSLFRIVELCKRLK